MVKSNFVTPSLLSVQTLILHVLAMPVYFLGFILIYQCEWINTFLEAGDHPLYFPALIATCILIGVLCASRIPMTACRRYINLNWWEYTLWSLGEIVIFSAFLALFIALLHGSYGYFPALGKSLELSFAILTYPYIIFALLAIVMQPDEPIVKEEDLIRFTDSTGRLKLVIASPVLLYVEAQENYVSIRYLEGEKPKEFTLRQSMRGIEELMAKHGIIRCQRSYFVNPRHVTLLRRDKEGFILAELDVRNKTVPVSPKYYEQLSKLL